MKLSRGFDLEEVAYRKEVGLQIRARMRETKTTAGQLGARCGVTRQAINFIRKGEVCPTLVLARRIAKELGMTAGEMLGW